MSDITLYAVGDSVVWGQGLTHETKFASLAYADLTGGHTLDPDHIRARSGAILGIHRAADGETFTELADHAVSRTAEHEVPMSRPTVREQITELEASLADPTAVDLLIVGGGLNDIDVRTLIDPFTEVYDSKFEEPPNASENDPIPADSDYELEDLIRTYCYEDMCTLVRDARRAFPAAVIVVTGYFPIVSSWTDFDVLADWRLFFHDSSDWLAGQFVRQSLYFNRRALHWLRKAVAELDADPSVRGPGIAFAHPAFEPDNSLEASDSWLWGMNVDDPMRSVRLEGCAAVGEDGATATCPMASTGHPNPEGARQYADAIVDRYRRARTVSLRAPLSRLGGENPSLRDSFERYGFDPATGVRACLSHTLVDSVTVSVATGDEGSDSDVFLSLTAGRPWYLDHDGYNDFEAGDDDSYSADPVLDGGGRLRLWDIDRIELHKDGIFDHWTVDALTLELNGVPVYEWDGSVTIEGADSTTFPDYPRQEMA